MVYPLLAEVIADAVGVAAPIVGNRALTFGFLRANTDVAEVTPGRELDRARGQAVEDPVTRLLHTAWVRPCT
jgi:hypothetical protein